MGFASRWGVSAWLTLGVCAALLGACSAEQPVSGPVTLTGEWATITPPEPLQVKGSEQKVCLQVDSLRDADFQNGVVVSGNGDRHSVAGEAVDSGGTTYALGVADRGGDTFCLYRAGEYPRGPDFPADRTIVAIRLRSEPPLQIGKIWWLAHDRY